ncbi:MAG: DUF3899 domain-containing protein, partial [Bacilli bacterium]|nr:DUF3899 domain-containing protein [Bacilli bacterium]
AIGAFCFCFFLQQNYVLLGWAHGLINGGIITALFGALYLVTHFGAFDMVVYGAQYVVFHMNTNPDKQKRYKDYVDYVDKRRERNTRLKAYPWPFLLYAGSMILAGIIIRLVATVV